MKKLLLTILPAMVLLCGCGSWEAEKVTEYFASGSSVSDPNDTPDTLNKPVLIKRVTVKAKQFQCMTDSTRINMKVEVDDLGKASMGTSVVDAESAAAIFAELKPMILALMMGG